MCHTTQAEIVVKFMFFFSTEGLSPGDGSGNKKKPTKQGRKWNDGRTTNKDMASLDFSDAKGMNGEHEAVENVEKVGLLFP